MAEVRYIILKMTNTTTAAAHVYSFNIRPSFETEIPSLVLETAEGTLEEALALCEEYDCKIDLSDAAGFDRGMVKRGSYRLI